MMTLFKSLVLSRLDYGSQLWSPTKIHQIIVIEKIQKAFTKLNILKDFTHSPTIKGLVISKCVIRNITACPPSVFKKQLDRIVCKDKRQNVPVVVPSSTTT